MIVVDDGSTDDTETTVRNIDDSRVKYVRLPQNSGACAARNEGIRLASGAYIAFNDSDDQWTAEKVRRQMEFLEEHKADVVVCKMECMNADGSFLHFFPNKDGSSCISYDELLRYNCTSTQTFFGKASCFKEMPFDIRMPRLQDWDEALRLSQKYAVFFQDEVLVRTFIQPDSITAHPEKGVRGMELLWEKQAAFLCYAGKNPVAEMKFLAQTFPSVKNRLKYLLARTGLYRIIFLLKNRK